MIKMVYYFQILKLKTLFNCFFSFSMFLLIVSKSIVVSAMNQKKKEVNI